MVDRGLRWFDCSLLAIWWVVMLVARVQATMLKGTMWCSEWLEGCIDWDGGGDETKEDG